MNQIELIDVQPKDKSLEEAFFQGFVRALIFLAVFFGTIVLCSFFGSCRSSKGIVNETKDSVRVEVRTNTVYVPDTIPIFMPAETVKVVAPDTLSHIETSIAVSEASISGGLLHHSLWNKQTPIAVEVQHKETIRDSIRTETKWRTRTITKEVERKKTWWEQTKSYGFYVMVLLVLWCYRKEVISIVRKIILKV